MVAARVDGVACVYGPMTDQPHTPPEDQDDDFLAAEYALGLTEGEMLARIQQRIVTDIGFAARVAGWNERLVAMTDDIVPVSPSKRAKKALMARLFPKVYVPLMQRLWVWKGITFAAIALLAYIAMPLLRPPAPDAVAPLYATQMSGESTLQVLAVADTTRGDLALRRVAGGAPEGRVLQLWALLPDQAPISLGVLPEDDVTRVALPADLLAQIDVLTLAISEEPQGGAPDGVPTGSILAVGEVSAL